MGVDRRQHLEAVAEAGLVVLLPVPRGGVDEPGAALERDVVGEDDRDLARQPGVPAAAPLEVAAAAACERGRRLGRAECACHCVGARRGDHERPPGALDRHVLVIGMDGDGEARGQRPRGRRPDRGGRRAQSAERRRQRRDEGIGDVDRRRAQVGVLDLGLGKRGRAGWAPVDGLLSPVEEPSGDATPENAHLLRFVRRIHGEVGMLPVTEDAESLELSALDGDVALRVGAAALADLELGEPFLAADFTFHLELDRQPVAVPPGHVGREAAAHRAVLHDDVLQHLVERVADVDVAVGVRRSVVQHEALTAGIRLEELLVEPHFGPAPEDLRLALGEVGAHREFGARQVERLPVIHRGGRPP